MRREQRFVRTLAATISAILAMAAPARGADVFLRLRVAEPREDTAWRVQVGGFRHDGKKDQWYLPTETVEVQGDAWSRWVDLGKADLHGRLNREGGLAEWPSAKLTVARAASGEALGPCAIEAQLADRADEAAIVIRFTERSVSGAIGFLLPHPLREKKGEFETGSQMAARHLAWAREACPGEPPRVGRFDLITSIWGHYDPALARQETEALRQLGFNVVGGLPVAVMHDAGVRTYAATWQLGPDPEASAEAWKKGEGAAIARTLATEDGRWTYEHMAHYVISDEIQTLDFRKVDRAKLDGWFRAYLRERGETRETLGRPLEEVAYPAEAMYERTLPRQADLATRRLMYHAAKFGQAWSVRQLRQTSDLVRAALPGMKTETLPSDHGFLGAWGPPHLGMGYRGLDFLEIGRREAVDVLSAEDWLGLNHMYGPGSTWTGAQTFEYLSAILRSGIGDRPVALRGLLTPSDDRYLRLKAYAALGQGAKSFCFWTYGPTCIGTENYWSDLRSEYDGIARFARALERGEEVLWPARPVRDPVAILYAVSHDLWHTDDPASFVETRLAWHALRHLGVQPDFLGEEEVEAGRLAGYRVLYLIGQCLTRRAAAAVDAWVRAGGVVYLAGGAATRDEFFEPCVPPFAERVWPRDAAARFVKEQGHDYNERGDLPGIRPLARAKVTIEGERPFNVKVIGCRLDLREPEGPTDPWGSVPLGCGLRAAYEDGKIAGATRGHGRGWVVAVGFLPGLAYSPFKEGQTTLDEVWPPEPRAIFQVPLDVASVRPVAAARVPVVGTSLLVGPKGAAVVLVNHTHRPIGLLDVRLRGMKPPARAVSTEGARVQVEALGEDVRLTLPLDVADVVLLPRE